MFEEFAIDPELIAEWEFFKELRDKFGIFEGRFIADFPHKKWKKIAAELLDQCSHGANPVRNHATIVEWLRSPGGARDLRFARQKRPYHESQSWIKNAEQQSRSFHAILSEKESEAENAIRMEETTCLTEQPLFQVDTQPRVARTDADLVAIAKPILRPSKQIKWIDRFLATLNERQELVFKTQAVVEYLCWLRIEGHVPELLELHLEKPGNGVSGGGACEELASGLRQRLVHYVSPAMIVSIRWWSPSRTENIHPRFLLTDVGGLHFDHGTDPGRGTTIVTLMGKKRWEDEWARYTPETTDLTYHGESILFPT